MEPVAPSGEGKEGVGQGAVLKGTWSHGSEGGSEGVNRIPPQLEFSLLNHNRCRSKLKVESIKVQLTPKLSFKFQFFVISVNELWC